MAKPDPTEPAIRGLVVVLCRLFLVGFSVDLFLDTESVEVVVAVTVVLVVSSVGGRVEVVAADIVVSVRFFSALSSADSSSS